MKYAEAAWWVMVSAPGYLAIGLIWARCSAVRLQEQINSSSDHHHPDPLEFQLIYHIFLWPFMFLANVLFFLLDFLLTWTVEPVKKRREEARNLRARAARLEELAESEAVKERGEVEILTEAAEEWRDLAKKLDL